MIKSMETKISNTRGDDKTMISISAFKAHSQIPKLAQEAGIGLEFTGLVDPIHYPSEFIEKIQQLSHYNLFQSAHGPFYDLIPASSDIEIGELAKAKFIRAIDASRALKIKHLIFHTGWMPNFYSDEIWIRNSIEFWNSIMEYCGESLIIYIENVFENKPLLVKEIVKGVNKKNFKMCLDIGHVNLTTNGKINEWIDELHEIIGHVHIHNNFGIEDNHNGLDQGNIEMHRILENLREKCPNANWNLEIRTNFEKSIEIISKYK